MSTPDAQLQSELETSLADSLAIQRPLLTHLNADTTWLLSVPVPPVQAWPLRPFKRESPSPGKPRRFPGHRVAHPRGKPLRHYYHVLIDPWLRGSQSDVTRFLSEQWHKEESAVQSVAEIRAIIAGIEGLATVGARRKEGIHGQQEASPEGKLEASDEERGKIDLVVVSHEFTDHMHKATLMEVDSSVPVFATDKAAGIIQSWDHFNTVITMPIFAEAGQDWREMSTKPLPAWVSVSRLIGTGDLLNYHSAVMIAFPQWHGDGSGSRDSGAAEAVIYTPHGISIPGLEPISSATPPIRTLGLMHGLHDINIYNQLNLGGHNGLKAQRLTGAKYWVGTHDEVKKGGGLVSWILKRKVVSLEEALRLEVEEKGGDDEMQDVRFAELGNGESLLLE